MRIKSRILPATLLILFVLSLPILDKLSYFFIGWSVIVTIAVSLSSFELFSMFGIRISRYLFTLWNTLMTVSISYLLAKYQIAQVTNSISIPNINGVFFKFFIIQFIATIFLSLAISFLKIEDIRSILLFLFSNVYIFLLLGLSLIIAFYPIGKHICYMLIVNNKFGDTGALIVGSKFGKIKLAPSISPRKTVEGLIGGIITGVLAGTIYFFLLGMQDRLHLSIRCSAVIVAITMNTLMSVAGHTGDLVESFIKRKAKVKDSGKILGGIGGVLDLIDTFLLSIPTTYLALLFTGFPF